MPRRMESPLARGAWIETGQIIGIDWHDVSPLARGAWIETRGEICAIKHSGRPSQEGRGLKQIETTGLNPEKDVAPRKRGVD